MSYRDLDPTRDVTATGVQRAPQPADAPADARLSAPSTDAVAGVVCRLGDGSCAGAHAAALTRAPAGRVSRSASSVLRLQRQYGNRYVQRVLDIARQSDGPREFEPMLDVGIQRAGVAAGPAKAVTEEPVSDVEEKPDPHNGAATIQCDGKGGYELVLNSWATAKCGTKDCVIAHESSHMADWKAKWPNGCKGQAKGYLPKGDPPDDPLMTVAEYTAFLKDSECRAHTADLTCAEALKPSDACKKTVEDYIKLTKTQKAKWC